MSTTFPDMKLPYPSPKGTHCAFAVYKAVKGIVDNISQCSGQNHRDAYNISSRKAVDYYLPQIQRQKNYKGNPDYCKEHGSYETHAESHAAVFYE